MDLRHAIDEVRRLTGQLQEALDAEDLLRCAELLPRRGEAMDAFEAAHRAATPAERRACGAELADLAAADRELQEAAAAGTRQAGVDQRSGFATPVRYPAEAAVGCVNRKA